MERLNISTRMTAVAVAISVMAGGAGADMLVSSMETDTVLRYDMETGAFLGVFVSAGSGGLSGPRGLARGPDGNLYVSSFDNGSVLRYDGATGAFVDAFVAAAEDVPDEPEAAAPPTNQRRPGHSRRIAIQDPGTHHPSSNWR